MFAVCISFRRSKSIPLDMVIICIEFKEYTKLRHIPQFFYRIIGQGSFYPSISEYFVGKAALADRCRRHDVSKGNLHTVIMDSCLRGVGRTIHSPAELFVACVHAGNLPLCVTHRHLISTVIICRCSPEIRLRNCLDHFSSCIFIRNQPTIENGEHHLKILSANADVVKASHDLHTGNRSFLLSFYLVNILSKCNLMSCLCPECFFSEKEGYGHCIFARSLLFSKRNGVCFFA